MLEVVDGERRDDDIEAAEGGQGLGEVVLDETDSLVVCEALVRRREHGLGDVEADAEHPWAIA